MEGFVEKYREKSGSSAHPDPAVTEAVAIETAEVRELLRSRGIVALRADKTEPAPEVDETLRLLGNSAASIPFYAVFPAGRPQKPITLDGVFCGVPSGTPAEADYARWSLHVPEAHRQCPDSRWALTGETNRRACGLWQHSQGLEP